MDLKKRSGVTLIGVPLGITFIFLGEGFFIITISIFFAIAAWEFANLFKAGGFAPSGFLMAFQVLGLCFWRWAYGFENDSMILPVLILGNMAYAIFLFLRGNHQAANAFVIMMGGVFYIGYLGGYYISIRLLTQGSWWTLISLLSIWITDSGAYFVGSYLGKHKLAPTISPKKTWEGYFGGIVFAVVLMPLLMLLFEQWGFGGLAIWKSVSFALVASVFSVFGDLGISVIKRQFGAKDSGKLLPGHGGLLDRTDTWLWNAALNYFIIVWFFI